MNVIWYHCLGVICSVLPILSAFAGVWFVRDLFLKNFPVGLVAGLGFGLGLVAGGLLSFIIIKIAPGLTSDQREKLLNLVSTGREKGRSDK